ncbi:flagellar biosynthetic protein FliO [Chitinimonas sp. BJYL2]|uniref:flagellar biosynthetic protein FliO n=1 Tax=Chitinimonas sp. BJYL2 TaxID=2976696 RepID=UPI0022B2F306|nr:flagellar biosynthetic protein FliO [Chitinimonas sp. BJYL2]
MLIRLLPAAALTAAACVCSAADEAAKVAALPTVATPSIWSIFQVMFALIVVVAGIIGTLWLMRRFGQGQIAGTAQMRIVGTVQLGPRERVVVVELRDTWLVLGVTGVEISTLHTLPKPADADQPTATANLFADRLAAMLARPAKPAGPGATA